VEGEHAPDRLRSDNKHMSTPRTAPRPTSTTDVLYDSLAASAKIVRKVGTIIDRRITRMAKELDDPKTTPARAMELTLCIAELGEALSRQVDRVAKLITVRPSPGSGDTAGATQTVSEIMSELVSGKKRHT
jgi:hypothetical protein